MSVATDRYSGIYTLDEYFKPLRGRISPAGVCPYKVVTQRGKRLTAGQIDRKLRQILGGMILAQLTVVQLDADTGTDVTFSPASAGGDTFSNNGRTYLYINNQDASQKTATITSPRECNQGFQHDVVVDIPAGERRQIGPFNQVRFTNNVEANYSDVTSLSVAAVSL